MKKSILIGILIAIVGGALGCSREPINSLDQEIRIMRTNMLSAFEYWIREDNEIGNRFFWNAVLKKEELLINHDLSDYESEKLWNDSVRSMLARFNESEVTSIRIALLNHNSKLYTGNIEKYNIEKIKKTLPINKQFFESGFHPRYGHFYDSWNAYFLPHYTKFNKKEEGFIIIEIDFSKANIKNSELIKNPIALSYWPDEIEFLNPIKDKIRNNIDQPHWRSTRGAFWDR